MKASAEAADPAGALGVRSLARSLAGRRVAVLTGAGCSTESGIPDYRGRGTPRAGTGSIQYAEFVNNPAVRRRYWARSVIGFPKLARARPNAGHRALFELERFGAFDAPITQNVDRLHRRAGSGDALELHGALDEVVCLNCGALSLRERLQAELLERNPQLQRTSARVAPDGDAELESALVEGFQVVDCGACGGVLKPHVVFFGEAVPKARVEAAYARVDGADALVVLGTSLAVYSGYRFARRAHERGIPIFIINRGPTRADDLAEAKIDGKLGELLPRLCAELLGRAARPPLLGL